MRRGFFILILVAVVGLLVPRSEIIPSDRKITWAGNAGISNGTPDLDLRTVYTNLSFPITLAALQTHLENCPNNQIVQLPAGTNATVFTSTLSWDTSVNEGVILRGAGMGQTVLTWSGYSSTSVDMDGVPYSEPPFSVEANLTEDATIGGTTIVLASVPSWVTVGRLIGIDELNDDIHADLNNGFNLRTYLLNGNRDISQVNRVLAKTTTNITVEIPHSWPWATARTAQIFQPGFNPSTTTQGKGWGIADLTLRYTFTGSVDEHPITCYIVDSPLFKNLEIDNMPSGRGILTYYVFRGAFSGMYIHDSHLYTGGQGYGLDLNDTTTSSLVENSLFKNLHVGVTVRYGSGGNVIIHNAFIEEANASAQTAGYSHHGNSSFYNLVEGNYHEPKVLGDWTHGASALNTLFRNRFLGQNDASGDPACISLEVSNRFWNIVGNIIGTDGVHNKFVSHSGSTAEGSQGNIFKIGGRMNINNDYGGTADAYSYTNGAQVLIHANYDTVNDAVTVNNPPGQSISESNLVNSYYLSSAPSYFTSGSGGTVLTWPLYDPYVASTFTNKPPIYLRLINGITNFSVASSGTATNNIVISGRVVTSGRVNIQ